MMDSDYEDVLSEQFDNYANSQVSPSKVGNHIPMTIKKIEKRKELNLGKKTVALETALTHEEVLTLKRQVKEKTDEIFNKI
jgi:hypothetical protein